MSIQHIHSLQIPKIPAVAPDKGQSQGKSGGLIFRQIFDKTGSKTPEGGSGQWPPLSKQELLEIVNIVQAQMNRSLMRAMSADVGYDMDIRLPFLTDRFPPLSRESLPQKPETLDQHEPRVETGPSIPSASDDFITPEGRPSKPFPEKQDHDVHNRRNDLESIINGAAAAHGVDPDLIRSMIRVESNFNPNSTSPKGAMGLMQLMPGTARDLGVQNAYDPVENIQAGTRYLNMLLNRYEGNVTTALAAYNWGMGNVERRPAQMPLETKSYIKNVTRHYEQTKA